MKKNIIILILIFLQLTTFDIAMGAIRSTPRTRATQQKRRTRATQQKRRTRATQQKRRTRLSKKQRSRKQKKKFKKLIKKIILKQKIQKRNRARKIRAQKRNRRRETKLIKTIGTIKKTNREQINKIAEEIAKLRIAKGAEDIGFFENRRIKRKLRRLDKKMKKINQEELFQINSLVKSLIQDSPIRSSNSTKIILGLKSISTNLKNLRTELANTSKLNIFARKRLLKKIKKAEKVEINFHLLVLNLKGLIRTGKEEIALIQRKLDGETFTTKIKVGELNLTKEISPSILQKEIQIRENQIRTKTELVENAITLATATPKLSQTTSTRPAPKLTEKQLEAQKIRRQARREISE